MKRILGDQFISDLKGGILKPLLEHVNKDSDLLFEIRDDYVNIYYRGGMVLRVSKNGKDSNYLFAWDTNYLYKKLGIGAKKPLGNAEKKLIRELASIKNVNKITTCRSWIAHFPQLIKYMNRWFKDYPKKEKFIQQEIVRSGIIKDYILSDFEYQKEDRARFDLMGFKSIDDKYFLSFIELKQGYKSLRTKKQSNGTYTSGLKKHLIDILDEIKTSNDIVKERKQAFGLLKQKIDLGTIPSITLPSNIRDDKIEVLFVIADYKTLRSSSFSTYLKKEIEEIEQFLKTKTLKFTFRLNIMFLKTEQDDTQTKILNASDIVDYTYFDTIMRSFY